MERILKTSVLKFAVLDIAGHTECLSGPTLEAFIESIRKMPLKLDENGISRYSASTTGNEHAVVFSDEIKTLQTDYKDLYVGVFLGRRGKNNRPLEDGEDGSLVQLTLQDETHEIAEVGYFGIHRESGIMFLTYNPMVGGMTKVVEYLNQRLNVLIAHGTPPAIPQLTNPASRIELYYIGFPDSETVFRENMERVQSFEFHIASDPENLATNFLFDDDKRDQTGMRLIREFAKESNCATISISLSAERPKKKKVKGKEPFIQYSSLNKQFLIRLYDSTKTHLQESPNGKFNVRGKILDEDSRILDLVHSRLTYPLEVRIPEGSDTLLCYINAISVLIRQKIEEAKKYYGYQVD